MSDTLEKRERFIWIGVPFSNHTENLKRATEGRMLTTGYRSDWRAWKRSTWFRTPLRFERRTRLQKLSCSSR